MSKLEIIQGCWDQTMATLMRNTDERCDTRVRQLNTRLKRLKIEKLICGMGTWTFDGPEFNSVNDEGEEWDYKINDLYDIYTGEVGPDDLTDDEEKALTELFELVMWWVDKTGGHDVEFNDKDAWRYAAN